MQKIIILCTGGTIDARPYENPSRPPTLVTTLKTSESLIPSTLRQICPSHPLEFPTLSSHHEETFSKDSKQYTDTDLMELAQLISSSTQQYFLLTHGTDAMVANASKLKLLLRHLDKVVILTGSMIPLSMHPRQPSDAHANLVYALTKIYSQKPGVWIVGRNSRTHLLELFSPDRIKKNLKKSNGGSEKSVLP